MRKTGHDRARQIGSLKSSLLTLSSLSTLACYAEIIKASCQSVPPQFTVGLINDGVYRTGFAGMTPLHEAVLLGSPKSVSEWIARSDKDERNFLGQTPLHLAVSNPRHLDALIQSGHDLDAADNYGITPLMYAAATNQEECLMKLIDAGANPHVKDTRFRRTFMHYAATRGHWKLVLNTLCKIGTFAEKEIAESWAQLAVILFHVVYPDYLAKRGVSFHQLLAKCGSVNITFHGPHEGVRNNTMLHYVRSVTDVETLRDHGFKLFNYVNSLGQHALMATANLCKPDLVHSLLDAGADVDLKDNLHHTTLYYVLDRLQDTNHTSTTCAIMDIVRILLAKGADGLSRDNCRCPCSPDGCLPAAVIGHSVYDRWSRAHVPVWSLEWLSIILEHRGTSEAKTALLSFIRRAKHEEMEMSHVCCRRRLGDSIFWRLRHQENAMSDDDIDDILDEESEFVDILECEMSQSSGKAYETLLDDWLHQIKTSLEKSRKEAIEHNERLYDYPEQVFTNMISCLNV